MSVLAALGLSPVINAAGTLTREHDPATGFNELVVRALR